MDFINAVCSFILMEKNIVKSSDHVEIQWLFNRQWTKLSQATMEHRTKDGNVVSWIKRERFRAHLTG